MTRGAAANAILDAGRSKKRLSLPPCTPPPAPRLVLILLRSGTFFPSFFTVRPGAFHADSFLFRSFALHAFRSRPPLPSVFSSFLFPCLSLSRSLPFLFLCLLLLPPSTASLLFVPPNAHSLSSCPILLSLSLLFFLLLFLSLSLSLSPWRILRRLLRIAALLLFFSTNAER